MKDPSFRGAADISLVAPYVDSLAGLGANGRSGQLDSMRLAVKRAAILIYRLFNE